MQLRKLTTIGSVLTLLAFCSVLFPSIVAAQTAPEKVSVAAAANVSSVGDALTKAFAKAYPAYALEFTFGASGTLSTQIKNGAPWEVFLSADTDFPKQLKAAGVTASEPKVYATGLLILLSTKAQDFKKGLAVLKDADIAKFAIANPATAPYGKAAQDALQKSGLWDTVKDKVVTGQTITQALQFTLTSAGIGFVNKSALYTKEVSAFDKEGVNWYAVDPKLYDPIEQAFVVLKPGADKPGVKAFAAFLSSPEAKAIFKAAGYLVP